MRGFKNELRKIVIHQKALLWILIFALLKLMGLVYAHYGNEMDNGEVYRSYLKQVGGKLDEEKEAFILTQFNEMEAATSEINDLEDDYAEGKINKQQYLDKLAYFSKLKDEESVIKQFYIKYKYVLEDRENRYIIDMDGWSKLLENEQLDYFLILLIMLVTVPIFCNEYETKMQDLHICSRNGRGQMIVVKAVIAGLLAMFTCLMFHAIEYFFYKQIYGLDYGYAPIRSLEFFKDSTLHTSLFSLWIMIVCIRILGALYTSLLVLMISVMVKRSLLAVVTNCVFILAPEFIITEKHLSYCLPWPTALIHATGYFYPNQYVTDEFTNEKVLTFSAFDIKEILLILILSLVIMIILVICIYVRNLNMKLRRRVYQKITEVAVICILTASLTGCNSLKGKEETENFPENSYSFFYHITDKYFFHSLGIDIWGVDLQTEEKFTVVRNPFEQWEAKNENGDCATSMFANNQYLYYLKSYGNRFVINRLRLSDFEEECLYESKEPNADIERYNYYFLRAVSEKYFFIYDGLEGKGYYIDRNTKRKKLLGNMDGITLGEYGEVVYYLDNNSRIAKYDLRDKKETVYDDIAIRGKYSLKATMYFIKGDFCYYTNMLDGDKIYCYCFSNGSNEMVGDGICVEEFWVTTGKLWYKNKQDDLICVDLDTKEENVILKQVKERIYMGVDGEHLYISHNTKDGTQSWKVIKG